MFKVTDMVVITVDHPYAVENEDIKGTFGMVVEVDKEFSTVTYRVCTSTDSSGYWYTGEELRPATETEKENALVYMMIREAIPKFIS